ncbi:hypothetical protein [Saccharopolyspora sp. NPDC049357]|uniref:hypothetical protein n=1 Tax=Saccharopolyspora sp. NPDC049357 TaxID=3154507 RepID=UPI00341B3357
MSIAGKNHVRAFSSDCGESAEPIRISGMNREISDTETPVGCGAKAAATSTFCDGSGAAGCHEFARRTTDRSSTFREQRSHTGSRWLGINERV